MNDFVDPLIGQVLQNRYRVDKLLGEGGMGAVYLGEHVGIRRKVAIKVLHAQHARRAETVTRFRREALAASQIGNEHIVEVLDLDQLPDGAFYMVMELLDGRDLSKAIETEGPLPVPRAVRIMDQVLDALGSAHAAGVIHRDLKPENIFLIKRGDNPDFVKLVDFGISKIADPGDGAGMTATGATMGTPYYMSPEQVSETKSADHRTDIYALGVVLYQMLSKRFPYESDTMAMLLVKILSETPAPLSVFRPDLPQGLLAVVEKMLARDPVDRYMDCAQVRVALAPFAGLVESVPHEALAATLATVTVPRASTAMAKTAAADAMAVTAGPVARTVGPETGTSGGGKRPGLFAVAGLAALVVAGAGGWLVLRGGSGSPPVAAASTVPVEAPAAPAPAPAPVPTPVAAPPAVAAPALAAATVRIQIDTRPEDAELLLDGNRIANPFDAELPQATDVHRLECRRDGWRAIVQDLVLQYPQRVHFALSRGSGTEDRRVQREPAAPSGEHAPAAHPSPTAEPSHAAPSAAPAPAPTPSPAPAATPTPSAPVVPARQQLREVEL